MDNGNRYIITEETLKYLIESTMKYEILENDGVEDWTLYMEGYKEYIEECFPDLEEDELKELSLKDCVEKELQNYPLL